LPEREDIPDPNIATVDVRVPADAEIWFQGSKTGQHGEMRTFLSPHLESGCGFVYDIRARWNNGNQIVEQTRQVHVHAGDRIEVDFNKEKAKSTNGATNSKK